MVRGKGLISFGRRSLSLSVGESIAVEVRVRLRVRGRNDKYVELVVLASGGAERPRPLIALDPETAAKIYFKGSEGAER